jgi:hypothetical protein
MFQNKVGFNIKTYSYNFDTLSGTKTLQQASIQKAKKIQLSQSFAV